MTLTACNQVIIDKKSYSLETSNQSSYYSEKNEENNFSDIIINDTDKNIIEDSLLDKELSQNNQIEFEVIDTHLNLKEDIYVKINKNNKLIEMILEDYLVGVVAAEMPASFNYEALKVQAIISRTYALKRIEEGKNMTDNILTQAFIDKEQMQTLWGNNFNFYYNKIISAVKETKNITIIHNNKIIDALFFSTSSGITEDSKFVWGNSVPYLKSVKSSECLKSSSYFKRTSYTYQEISNILSIPISKNTKIKILSRTASNAIDEIKFDSTTFKGTLLRSLLKLPSTNFEITLGNNEIYFETKGYGHGVGLSQWGANGMADKKYSFIEIIQHYYYDVKLVSY